MGDTIGIGYRDFGFRYLKVSYLLGNYTGIGIICVTVVHNVS